MSISARRVGLVDRSDATRTQVPVWGALAALLVAIAISLAVEIVVQPRGDARALGWPSLVFDLGRHTLLLAAALVAVGLAAGRVTASRIGLHRVQWQPAFTSAALLYTGYLLLTGLFFALAGEPPQKPGAAALGRVDSVPLLAGFALVACVFTPVAEEILFRGVIFSALRHRLRAMPAVLLGGMLFGVVHGPPVGSAVQLVLLGIALCLLYEQTGSIIPCIGLHAANNAIAFAGVTDLALPISVALTVGAITASVAVTVPVATRPTPSTTQ